MLLKSWAIFRRYRDTCEQVSDFIIALYFKLARATLLTKSRIQTQWCCAFCLEIMASIDDVFIEVVYDAGHPWRISCVHYKVVTGVVPRQESRDPKGFKKVWSGRRRSRGPSPQNFCPSRCAFEGRVLT